MNVNIEQLEKQKEVNFEERLQFIDLWVNYIKTHSDKEWSEQQNIIIDSQIH
jgi:hypothetical protein